MITFACGKCGKKFSVPDTQAGKKGKCPQCQEIIVIPAGAVPPAASVAVPAMLLQPHDLLGSGPETESEDTERATRPRDKAPAPVKHAQSPHAQRPVAAPQAISGGDEDKTSRLWVIGICGVAALFVIGLLVYVFVLRDTWEKDNRGRIQGLSQEVISLAGQDNESAMVLKHGELKALLGSRTLKNQELQTVATDADAAVAEAKGRLAAAKQAADRKRREDEERKATAEAAIIAEIRESFLDVAKCKVAKDGANRTFEIQKQYVDTLSESVTAGIASMERLKQAVAESQDAAITSIGKISAYQAALRKNGTVLSKYPGRGDPILRQLIVDPQVPEVYRRALVEEYSH